MIARGNNRGKPYLLVVSNILVILALITPLLTNRIGAGEVRMPSARFKVLHIMSYHSMSYHSPWEWTDEQFRGFKDALKGVEIEYKVFQMDTKRNSSPEWKEKVAREATHLIETWKMASSRGRTPLRTKKQGCMTVLMRPPMPTSLATL
jgi:hypothetical protein